MNGSDISSPFLPLPDGICISSVRTTTTELVVSIASTKTYALCPRCGASSERIHGHYGRTAADLPCGGRRVILALTVRKFVCTHSSCPQKIFTERLAELVQSHARMTNRLRDALVALGLATSAEVSERVAPSLGMCVSAPTLLRRLRDVVCPPPKSVRISRRWMIGRGKKARPMPRCLWILSYGNQSNSFQIARKPLLPPGYFFIQKSV
jgi:zinc-finger of transposase IS204/IS1001/IS1096/IS1165